MNAGPDVERLISDWLAEEAPTRAPDRILGEAASVIDRTTQRHLFAAWREPMLITTSRLIAVAAVIVIAIVGAGAVGRATGPAPVAAPPNTGPSASPGTASPAPSLTEVSIVEYRTARDAVCVEYTGPADGLKAAFDGLYEPMPGGARIPKIRFLEQFTQLYSELVSDLRALDAPPDVRDEHSANIARFEDVRAILTQIVALLRADKLVEAEALDQATNGITSQIGTFERKYNLKPCP